jgi:hypothetical protein
LLRDVLWSGGCFFVEPVLLECVSEPVVTCVSGHHGLPLPAVRVIGLGEA